MPDKRFYQFTDAHLCFEVVEENSGPVLRLIHGYDHEAQIFLYIHLGKEPSFIPTQIEMINKLLKQFPCRCHEEHELFEHSY